MRKLICSFLLVSFIFSIQAQELHHIKIDSINAVYDEFNPVLTPDGSKLYVTRKGHEQNVGGVVDAGDIWFASKTETGWSALKHAGSIINHDGLNGVVGFSADGQRMYVLNYTQPGQEGAWGVRAGIAVSQLENGIWTKPVKLGIKFFQNQSEHISATIARDEQVLIVSMKSYQTEGNEDLYVSLKQADGTWSELKNLGANINTYAEEWDPFLADDNKTLYYTSNGFEGYGSRDIYKTERIGDSWTNWSAPENLGPSINTEGVERSFYIPSGTDYALFSTTQNSEGNGDIFSFPIEKQTPAATEQLVVEEPEPIVIELPEEAKEEKRGVVEIEQLVWQFEILDIQTKEPIVANVVITYNGQLTELTSNGSQEFLAPFVNGASASVEIRAEGYLAFKEEIILTQQSELAQLYLTKSDVGTTIKIENVLFQRGKALFSTPKIAQAAIDKLIDLMNDNPELQIRLEGHTDNRGDARNLQKLSEDRVNTVRSYMVAQGIDIARIDIVGYGGEKPIADNNSADNRELNRRVEFVIIR